MGGGALKISSDRGDRRIFGGIKYWISGFFWVGKFWQVFFFGSLIYGQIRCIALGVCKLRMGFSVPSTI